MTGSLFSCSEATEQVQQPNPPLPAQARLLNGPNQLNRSLKLDIKQNGNNQGVDHQRFNQG